MTVDPTPDEASPDLRVADVSSVKVIVGVTNVEDLLLLPNSRWVIGSGYNWQPARNFLHLFDSHSYTGGAVPSSEIVIRPDVTTYPGCAPPQWSTFGPHGIGLGPTMGTRSVLYVVNHGGREAVEVFDLDTAGQRPRLTWTGCIVMPSGFWPDSVAALPDGGIVVTSMEDPTDPDGSQEKLLAGAPVGGLKEWHSGSGFTDVPGAEDFSGPNGVIVSEDGLHIYVALSSGRQVARITRGLDQPKVDLCAVGILPDNVRWSASGNSVLIGGHDVTPVQFIEHVQASLATSTVGGNIDTPFKILRMDPHTLTTTEVLASGVYGGMGGGTGAIEVADTLWVSSMKADRIAIFTLD